MPATLVLAALAAQLTSIPGAEPGRIEQRDVAYEAIAEGRTDDAIRTIEPQLANDPHDPALLINLGAAYARRGNAEQAARAYQAAIDSETHYQLELADGTWADSRQAARRGLEALRHHAQLARLGA